MILNMSMRRRDGRGVGGRDLFGRFVRIGLISDCDLDGVLSWYVSLAVIRLFGLVSDCFVVLGIH